MARKRRKPRAKHHHSVYVIELDASILNLARFRKANPDRDILKPCVYVGMTGLPPGERFQNHKAGVKANWYVKKFGLGLLPDLFIHLNPMPYEAAQKMEQDLADELQEKGYAVWQA